jgi:hypothetical protein
VASAGTHKVAPSAIAQRRHHAIPGRALRLFFLATILEVPFLLQLLGFSLIPVCLLSGLQFHGARQVSERFSLHRRITARPSLTNYSGAGERLVEGDVSPHKATLA